jgi:predicted alpha/beta hydrolase family esterase
MTSILNILYLHGLPADGPEDDGRRIKPTKAIALERRGHSVVVPFLPTAKAVDLNKAGRLNPQNMWDTMQAFNEPLRVARDAIEARKPDVIVGSSFGGAVLAHLVRHGVWGGPSVFCASAATKFLGICGLATPSRAIFIHGKNDVTVPIEHSRAMAGTSTKFELFEVCDDHRLNKSFDVLSMAVERFINL